MHWQDQGRQHTHPGTGPLRDEVTGLVPEYHAIAAVQLHTQPAGNTPRGQAGPLRLPAAPTLPDSQLPPLCQASLHLGSPAGGSSPPFPSGPHQCGERVLPLGSAGRPGGPDDSLCSPHVAVQVQPQGSHGKVLQTPPPPWKLPFHLPSASLVTGCRWPSRQCATPERQWLGPHPARRPHLVVQAHEAQGVANTLHLVQDVGVKDHGCEGDEDGVAAPCRDHLAQTALLGPCLASRDFSKAAPSPAPTYHLLGPDAVQVVGGHSLVPLQDN